MFSVQYNVYIFIQGNPNICEIYKTGLNDADIPSFSHAYTATF